MKVKDIMSKEVKCLCSEDSVQKAAHLMKQNNVGSLPVCSQKKVVGIVTDRDLALRSIAEGQGPKQRIKDVMSSNIAVGSPDMDVHDAAKIMSDRQIRRLPIVENNTLVGIVALGDISVEPTLQDNAEVALRKISLSSNPHM